VLRALGRGMATDDERFRIRDFFAAIPDLALSADDLDGVLLPGVFAGSGRRARRCFGELSQVASTLPDPVDRYWMMVYTLVSELPATVPSWRRDPFTGVMAGGVSDQPIPTWSSP